MTTMKGRSEKLYGLFAEMNRSVTQYSGKINTYVQWSNLLLAPVWRAIPGRPITLPLFINVNQDHAVLSTHL